MEMGRIHDRNHPRFPERRKSSKAIFDDTSVMLYTSGTTGPKGVCQTHAAFIAAAHGAASQSTLPPDGDILST